jgi:hypothetical protein
MRLLFNALVYLMQMEKLSGRKAIRAWVNSNIHKVLVRCHCSRDAIACSARELLGRSNSMDSCRGVL